MWVFQSAHIPWIEYNINVYFQLEKKNSRKDTHVTLFRTEPAALAGELHKHRTTYTDTVTIKFFTLIDGN